MEKKSIVTKSYTKTVMDHFQNPKNMGEMENPDGLGKVGNAKCGDLMWIYIKVGKNKKGEEVLADVKFKTFGCVAAISVSSMITEIAKGKTLAVAEKLTNRDVAEALHGLPTTKLHCSNLGADALRAAIKNYREKKK